MDKTAIRLRIIFTGKYRCCGVTAHYPDNPLTVIDWRAEYVC